MPSRRVIRVLLAAVLLLGIGAALPLARFWSLVPPVQSALERALDRRVEISGPVRLRLLPSPALTLSALTIHDDPSIGIEPIAYVESAELGVEPFALLTGHLALTSLRLNGPSVNLVKTAAGQWNYPPLFRRAFVSYPNARPRLPLIEVRSARLNFKFGDTKNVFYLSDADVDIQAGSGGGDPLRFRFSGSPSRTDRAAQGFGKFSGNGQFEYVPEGENRVQLVVRLERSAIPDILTLLQGHGSGLGGFLASRAEIEGPVSDLSIRGELQLADIDRRFLLPVRQGDWALNYTGHLDLVGQQLRLRTTTGAERLPISVRLFLADYLAKPRWATVVTADSLPLETLPALAAEMGSPILPGLSLRGALSGALSRSVDGKIQGQFRATGIGLSAPDGESLQVEEAEINSTGGVISVQPTRVTVDDQEVATLRGSYSRAQQQLEIGVRGRRLSIARFSEVWQGMTDRPVPPALTTFSGGDWTGDILFRGTPDEETWTGKVEIRGATLELPGLASPVAVTRASMDTSSSDIRLEGTAGGIAFGARRRTGKPLELSFAELDAVALEKILAPTLGRRPGLIARTLRRTVPVPDWITERNLTAEVQIKDLLAGPIHLTGVGARLFWRGPDITLNVLSAEARPGHLAGRLTADLRQGSPRYHLAARVDGLRWAGGTLKAEGRLTTAGRGLELVARARAEGEFSVAWPRRSTPERVTGCYEFSAARPLPELSFSCLTIHSGADTYYGWGRAAVGQGIELVLFNDAGRYRAAGSLEPFSLTIEPEAVATLK